ncbi:MAG: transposase, partial [Gammaproteobacteria bacterium]|nr:transposase [Gammaproteobacteria bacterium]
AGANQYAEYQAKGLGFITRAHQRLKVEGLKVLRRWSETDWWVELGINPQYRKENSKLPETIVVRMIRVTANIEGRKETFWVATSLLDAGLYPAQEVCGWLKKRWKVEGLIGELKGWIGADVLRSKTVEGIRKELYARIFGLNLIHWLILKAAKKHKKEPERLSVSAALRLTVTQSLKMSTAPVWQLPSLFDELLERIATSSVPYRPYRIEPRMVKQQPKHYPALKMTRVEWRALYALAA